MKLASAFNTLAGAIVLVVIGTAIGARLTRPPAGADITEGGSPLYSIAVEESVKGLLSKEDKTDSTQDKVCPQCGKVHASPAPAGVNPPVAGAADAGAPAPGQGIPCPECGQIHAASAPEQGVPCPQCGQIHGPPHGIPPDGAATHSAGGTNGDYFYCAKCKVYHRREAQLEHRDGVGALPLR